MDVNTANVADIDATKPIEEQLAPVYDENGKLTRQGMENVIKEGGSVMYGHRLITKLEDLPSEAQLAKGDAVKTQAARERIEAQMAAMKAELDMLGADEHTKKAGAHGGHLPFPTRSDEAPGGGVTRMTIGEGDTAGLDGDRSDPDTAAGKKAQAEAEEAEKARAEAEKAQAAADKAARAKAEGK